MNGGMAFPPGYEDMESRSERAFVKVSRAVARVVNFLAPGKREAATLLVANERTRRALPFADHPAVFTLPENGVDLDVWRAPERAAANAGTNGVFRLLYSGRLVRWKAVDITLEAIARARAQGVSVELDILGDGPERSRLEALCSDLGIASAIRFHGFVPQSKCVEHFGRADALILNSVWECGGAVVLEAMAMALPVIGPDWGGPADYVDEATGIRVSPTPRATYAERLAAA